MQCYSEEEWGRVAFYVLMPGPIMYSLHQNTENFMTVIILVI